MSELGWFDRLLIDRRFTGVLWVLVATGTIYLAYRNYLPLLGHEITNANGYAGDFWGFLHASRQIAAGHSPYNLLSNGENGVGYVYSPFLAVLLLPFTHLATIDVWEGWNLVSLGCVILAIGVVVATEVPADQAWVRPVLFGFAAVTGMQTAIMVNELYNGQTDTITLALLSFAAAMLTRRRWATSGALVGVAGLIKTWPATIAVTFLTKHVKPEHRWRALVAWVVTIAVAPLLAVILGGISELRDWLRITFDARSQHLVSFSVSGAPKILFSHNGFARPLVDSSGLQAVATIVLAAWVIGLLVLTLRRCTDITIGFWQVTVCVVLLVPASHEFYCLYTLPLLWIWGARALEARSFRSVEALVVTMLLVCWVVMYHDWNPYKTGLPAWHYVILFFANLAAVTISVLGERLRDRTSSHLPYSSASGRVTLWGASVGTRP